MPRQANQNQNKFVMIQSNQTIRVTSGLQYDDFTKKDSDIPDRLKVAPQWQNKMVLIQKGQHTYPAEIASWKTVLSLQKNGILTIGAFTNDDADGASQIQKELDIASASSKSLSDIAGD